MLNLKYDKYEELVKEDYKLVLRVVPITHETMGLWAPDIIKFTYWGQDSLMQ